MSSPFTQVRRSRTITAERTQKPPIVNQQNFVYYHKCGLCDAKKYLPNRFTFNVSFTLAFFITLAAVFVSISLAFLQLIIEAHDKILYPPT